MTDPVINALDITTVIALFPEDCMTGSTLKIRGAGDSFTTVSYPYTRIRRGYKSALSGKLAAAERHREYELFKEASQAEPKSEDHLIDATDGSEWKISSVSDSYFKRVFNCQCVRLTPRG